MTAAQAARRLSRPDLAAIYNAGLTQLLAQVEHRLGHPSEAAGFGRQSLRASYAAGETLDAASAHTRMSNFLAAGTPRQARQAPVHVLATAVIQSRVNGKLLASGFQSEPLTAALTRLAMCQARQPELILKSFPDLASNLADTVGIDLASLLAGLERVPVEPGPEPGSRRAAAVTIPSVTPQGPGSGLGPDRRGERRRHSGRAGACRGAFREPGATAPGRPRCRKVFRADGG